MQLRSLRPGAARSAVRDLEERVADLEADLGDLRRHQMRLAELADVVEELLVPLASRDEERIQAAITRYQGSL